MTFQAVTKDGASVVGTLTREELLAQRAAVVEVHVVLHQSRGGAGDE